MGSSAVALVFVLLLSQAFSSVPMPKSNLHSYSYSQSLSLFQPYLSSWTSRVVGRGLAVDGFGKKAEAQLQIVEDCYDGLSSSVLFEEGDEGGALSLAKDRRLKKVKLMSAVKESITDLWNRQMEDAKAAAVSDFKKKLLANFKVDRTTGEKVVGSGEAPGSIMRKAVFDFDRKAADLEVKSLGLLKTKASQDFSNELAEILANFDSSPSAQLKVMTTIKNSASKPKPPSERGVTPTFHLVGMIRPDGFANLQGFAGYTMNGGELTFSL